MTGGGGYEKNSQFWGVEYESEIQMRRSDAVREISASNVNSRLPVDVPRADASEASEMLFLCADVRLLGTRIVYKQKNLT
jgi:hypothetical protein